MFHPIYFDADEWVKTAKAAGMNYFVITAKHHDGFALFKSEASKFNSVDATPFGRDIVGELAESCAKYGMKMGLYYSQTQDWVMASVITLQPVTTKSRMKIWETCRMKRLLH